MSTQSNVMAVPMTWVEPKGDVVTREIVGQMIIIPIRASAASGEDFFKLNPVGAFLWTELCRGGNGASVESLVDAVTRRFVVDHDTANADVREFIAALETVGLAALSQPESAGGPK